MEISIHAPRVGSDWMCAIPTPRSIDFNPRSPCGERRKRSSPEDCTGRFQSTLPVWGATPSLARPSYRWQRFQSTLPVWGATFPIFRILYIFYISIHAPRVGSDYNHFTDFLDDCNFNPRSPCGERPGSKSATQTGGYFNPRSPCGERPTSRVMRISKKSYFNPRSPCGERP